MTVTHPDAWRHREIVFPTGAEVHLAPPSRADLEREGIEIIEECGPSLLVDNMILITGQVEQYTSFERGFPLHQSRRNGQWEPDAWIWDDQAAVINVRNRGLVVLSGCSHARAIDVFGHTQRSTGVERIHAFVGGMHLTGGIFEPIIGPTLDESARLGPMSSHPATAPAGRPRTKSPVASPTPLCSPASERPFTLLDVQERRNIVTPAAASHLSRRPCEEKWVTLSASGSTSGATQKT
jgi:hypothetical protein